MIYVTPEKINATNAKEIADEWLNTLCSGQDLIIDLSNTVFISGDGYKLIFRALKISSMKNLDFCVCNPSDEIRKVFDDYGLSGIIAPFTEVKDRLR